MRTSQRANRASAVSHATDDLGLESTALPSNCFQLAEEHWRDSLVGRGDRSILYTTPSDFGQWGIGIELYFTFTRSFAMVSGIVVALYLPLLLLCCRGDATESLDISAAGRVARVLSWSTIPNMGRFINIENSSNSTDTMISTDSTDLTNFSNFTNFTRLSQLDYADRKVTLFGEKIDIRHVTFATGILDSIASLVILCTAWWFELVVIPRVVMRHRAEHVTPDIYTVFVDCLPRRLFGGGGQEKYSLRLQQHFAMLLAAQVTTKSARKRLRVVDIKDKGGPIDAHKMRCCCCCRRHSWYDAKGRRIGRIVSSSGTSCVVQWMAPADPRSTRERQKKFRLSNGEEDGDLLDASLLWRLESCGLKAKSLAESQAAVHSVHLQRDFRMTLGKMKADAKRDDRKFESRVRAAHRRGRRNRLSVARLLSRETPDEAEEELCLEERDVVGAFIIFSCVRERHFIYAEYQSSRTPLRLLLRVPRLMFSGERLRVSEAPPPSDVFWENLDFPFTERFGQTVKVFLICSLMSFSVITVIAVARNKAESASTVSVLQCDGGVDDHPNCVCHLAGFSNVLADNPPGIHTQCRAWLNMRMESYAWWFLSSTISMVVIVFAGFIVDHLARLERPRSITAFNKIVMIMTTIVYVLVLGIIRVLINAKWPFTIFGLIGSGRYADLEPEWYVYVGTSVMTTLGLNSIYPCLGLLEGPFHRCWLWLRKDRQQLMTDLLDLYTPPPFPFALRHAEQLAQLFACLTFCSGMPFIAVFMCISFWLHYWCDKYVFLRSSKTPPRYKHHLMLWQVRLLQFAVVWHACFSTWVYANRSAPSHRIFRSSNDSFSGLNLHHSHGLVEPLLDKMLSLSSIPSAAVGCIVVITTCLRLLFPFLVARCQLLRSNRSAPGISLHDFFIAVATDTLAEEQPSFAAEMPSMKRQGIKTHYDVQHMPGFEFLLPRAEAQKGLLEIALGVEKTKDHAGEDVPAAATLGAPLLDGKRDAPLDVGREDPEDMKVVYDLRGLLQPEILETGGPPLKAAQRQVLFVSDDDTTSLSKDHAKAKSRRRRRARPEEANSGRRPPERVENEQHEDSGQPAAIAAKVRRRPKEGALHPAKTQSERPPSAGKQLAPPSPKLGVTKTRSARGDFAGGAQPSRKLASPRAAHLRSTPDDHDEMLDELHQQDLAAARARLGLKVPRSPRAMQHVNSDTPLGASSLASARSRLQNQSRGKTGRARLRHQSSVSDTELETRGRQV